MKIDRLDHVVFTVADIKATCDFYTRVLGTDVVTFAGNRTGSADVCFITETPLEQVMQHLRDCGIDIVEGPVDKTGAIGALKSVYIRDPDQNLIEISNYVNSK